MVEMNLLAFETSTRRLSVALFYEGGIIERAEVLPNGGSERLLPWVKELLLEAGIELSDLNGIAFGIGPGSFTGLRLAAGCAQGLAYGLNIPVVGVGTLEAVALESGKTRVIACLDARMNEVYSAAYEEGREVLAPSVTSPERIPQPLGDGWVKCDDVLPTARAIATLAAPRLQRGEGVAAALAIPIYVRDKVAKTTAERLAEGGDR
ncbi:MAG: tRNA (adenosine(37)-N6)-threonylcarbamoyltransferase complex dimerization subunit type 1 TsaB [Rhodocyclaceae bacterium]|nr:tRNA (adenosine(37)-N6)-threonylcarbamoyltransferase complex dimerization subunit type 1 TsaB [Rhodocyclaceae bacterium]